MSKNKTILFVSNFLSPETNPLPSFFLAEKITRKGWETKIVSKNKNKILRLIDMVFTLIKNKNHFKIVHIDVFSGCAFIWVFCVGQIANFFKLPIVLTLGGGNLPEFSKKYKKFIKVLFSKAAKIVTPSDYLFEQMKIYGNPEQFVVIPNPIEITNYQYSENKNLKKIIWLRSYRYIYNPQMAVETFECLMSKYPDLSLTFIGPNSGDGTKEKLQESVKKNKFEDRIFVEKAIPQNSVGKALSENGIFLNTTNIDNTPVSVIEAMASGLCVISTDVGGVPYLVEHEKDGLLVPANNHNAMANAIDQILSNENLASNLSRNARKKAESYDWSVILPKWEALFLSILK